MDDKVTGKIVLSILKFLRKEVESGTLTEGAVESIEVAIQCLESAYGADSSMEVGHLIPDLIELFCASDVWTEPSTESFVAELSDEVRAEAEQLKNAGNNLMKEEKYSDAIKKYSSAIVLDGNNAVYFCNRAAAQSKLNNHLAAIEDCKRALLLDPTYSKAYGRLGIAYSSLNQHEDARNSYLKALELEPDNESYKNNLSLTNEQISQHAGENSDTSIPNNPGRSSPPFDLSMLINNPALMTMASQMLNNPNMQNIMTGLMSVGTGDASVEALLQAGQQLAQHMQTINPEFVDTLRRQMGGPPDSNDTTPRPPDQEDGADGENPPQ